MRPLLPRQAGVWLFLLLAVGVGAAAFLAPRADLPPSYHHFADQRAFLGIPNFGDVASNVAFLTAGLWGLIFLTRNSSNEKFVHERKRWPYFLVFLGLELRGADARDARHGLLHALSRVRWRAATGLGRGKFGGPRGSRRLVALYGRFGPHFDNPLYQELRTAAKISSRRNPSRRARDLRSKS